MKVSLWNISVASFNLAGDTWIDPDVIEVGDSLMIADDDPDFIPPSPVHDEISYSGSTRRKRFVPIALLTLLRH